MPWLQPGLGKVRLQGNTPNQTTDWYTPGMAPLQKWRAETRPTSRSC